MRRQGSLKHLLSLRGLKGRGNLRELCTGKHFPKIATSVFDLIAMTRFYG